MTRQCPNCNIPLNTLDFNGIQLDDCPQCGGVWFDDGELQAAKSGGTNGFLEVDNLAHPHIAVISPKNADRLCPNCHTKMRSYHYLYSTPIILDECETCHGVWVDDEELTQMCEVAEQQRRADPANEKEAAALALATMAVATENNLNRAAALKQFCGLLSIRRSPYLGYL